MPKSSSLQSANPTDGKDGRPAPPPKVAPKPAAAPKPAGLQAPAASPSLPGKKAADQSGAKSSKSGSGGNNSWGSFFGFLGKNKKTLGIAGIIVLLVGAIMGALFSLSPFKLEALMKAEIQKRVETRIDHYIEARSIRFVQKYLNSSVGESDAAFDKNIVATGHLGKDLYKTWRLNKYEDKIAEKTGTRFARNAKGGVDVFTLGGRVGTLTDAQARPVINQSVKSVTKWNQFILRRHLRQWMRNAYGVSKWSFFRHLFNSKAKPATTDDEVVGNTIDNAATPLADQIGKILTCVLGILGGPSKCETDANNPDQADRVGDLNTQDSRTGNSHDSDVTKAVEDGEKSATDKAKEYLHNAAEALNTGKPANKLVSRILSKILGDEIGKDIATIITAAKGPLIILSMVDVASRIDHFFWYGAADQMVVQSHEVEYANQFAEFLTIEGNMKNGKTMTGDEFNSSQKLLDGWESSAAYQNMLGNTGGQSLTSVDDGTGKIVNDPMARSIDEHAHPVEDFYQLVFGTVPFPGGALVPGTTPGQNPQSWHNFLETWHNTAGRIWGPVNSLIGDIFGGLLSILEKVFPPLRWGMDWLTSHITDWLVKLIVWLVKPAVDGTERRADLANGVDAGGVVTGIGMARNLGAAKLSRQQGYELDNAIAKEDAANANQLSLGTRLFSPDYADSLVNKVALYVPTSPTQTANESLGYFYSVVQEPARALAPLFKVFGLVPQAHAAANGNGADNLYGMYDWGYTDNQLGGDDSAQLEQAWQNATTRLGHEPTSANDLELGDCPKVANESTDPNLCRLDVATVQSLEANSTNTDNGGLNSGGGGQN